MSRTVVRYIWAGFWGAYAGIGMGYLVAKRKYEKIADEEIQSVKERYDRRQEASFRDIQRSGKITGDELKKMQAPVEAEKAIKEYGGESFFKFEDKNDPRVSVDDVLAQESQEISEDLDYYDLDTVEGEDLEPNVHFEKDDNEEPAKRRFEDSDPSDPENPYVISIDEFMDDEPAHDKITLTYYEGDDILADDRDKVIRSVDKVIGDESITQFGERSGSDDTVYVRNERLKADYEVALEERSYQEVALRMKPPKQRGIRFQEDRES